MKFFQPRRELIADLRIDVALSAGEGVLSRVDCGVSIYAATTSERVRQVQEPFSLQSRYPLPRRTASDTSIGATCGCSEAMSCNPEPRKMKVTLLQNHLPGGDGSLSGVDGGLSSLVACLSTLELYF